MGYFSLREDLMHKIMFFFVMILSVTQIAFGENCSTDKSKINQLIKDSKSCQIDSDCEIAFFFCPFGCGVSLNKQKVEEISNLVGQYMQSCPKCMYRCPSGKILPKCNEGRCIEVLDITKTN